MNGRAIALDFDGTLVDCKTKQLACLRDGAHRMGVDLDEEKIWELKRCGHSNDSALTQINLDSDVISEIKNYWRAQIETEKYISYDKLHDDVLCTLKSLSLKTKLYIISARKNSCILINQVEQLSISNFFSGIYVVNPENVVDQKANILKQTGSACYFGDTEHDDTAARRVNRPAYVVSNGQRSPEFLAQRNVPLVYPTLSKASEAMLNDRSR